MKKSLRLVSVIFISSAVWLAAPSLAFGGHGDGACKSDVEKFCSGVSGGRRAVGECLHQHQSDLSAECEAKLEKFARYRQRFAACRDDAKKLCAGAGHDKGQVRDCLSENESELSDGCRGALKPQS